MTYKPLNDFVIVEPIEKTEQETQLKSAGGIFLATNSAEAERREHLLKGKVIAKSDKIDCLNEGDLVYFVKAAKCPIPDSDYNALKLEHIVTVIGE